MVEITAEKTRRPLSAFPAIENRLGVQRPRFRPSGVRRLAVEDHQHDKRPQHGRDQFGGPRRPGCGHRGRRPVEAFAIVAGKLFAHRDQRGLLDEQAVVVAKGNQPVGPAHGEHNQAVLESFRHRPIDSRFDEIIRQGLAGRIGKSVW